MFKSIQKMAQGFLNQALWWGSFPRVRNSIVGNSVRTK